MRSRLLLLSSIIGACVVGAPSAALAQRIGRVDRGRYELDHQRYDLERRLDHAHVHASERAARAESRSEARAESRSEARAESRAYASMRRSDRAYLREDHAMRMRDRADARQAARGRSRYRW